MINKDEKIEITSERITITKGEMVKDYNTSEIVTVVIYKSGGLDYGIPFTPMDYYYYARILTKGGEQLIITCLLTPNIDKVLRETIIGVEYERKASLICSVNWGNLEFR